MNKPNTVFCQRYKEVKPALSEAPLPGPLGQLLLHHVSEEAFNEWAEVQIKIINEERLDLSEEAKQDRLFHQMVAFFNLSELVDLA